MANIAALTDHVWAPIPGTSQELALDSRAQHTLYTGARGPGKTDTQLMRFRRRVGIGYGAFWKGVIFDREYKNLADIIAKSKRWFYAFDDGAKFLESAGSLKWVWPTGEELLFRAIKKDDEYYNFHGHEYPFIGWNELTKYPTGSLYVKLMSVNRCSFVPERDTPKRDLGKIKPRGVLNARQRADGVWEVFDTPDGLPLPPIPLEVFSTCNPSGPGHTWVKRKFIDVAPYGVVHRTKFEVTDPKTKKEIVVERTQVAIFGSYVENVYLTAEYIASLHAQTDEATRRAWLEGDWDIVAGGAFDDKWNKPRHVLPRFVIPATWRIDRAFDWGSTHPFCVQWFAEANGEEAIIHWDGKNYTFCPPPGTLIMFFEWYGSKELGSNVGLKMAPADIAKHILEVEESLTLNGWINGPVYAGPADNQIRAVTRPDVDTIEKTMADAGVTWEESDKSPGSRKIGMQLVRDRLQNSVEGEKPGLYVTENCRATIALLPTLPRDPDNPDDVDTDAEDHAYDSLRYRVLKGNIRTATVAETAIAIAFAS
jgi:hypothetical protein